MLLTVLPRMAITEYGPFSPGDYSYAQTFGGRWTLAGLLS